MDGGQEETSASGKQTSTEKQKQLRTDGEPEPLQPAGPGSRWVTGGGAYPEYDVESEDKILDAAAHFVSFKMLP